MNDFRPQAVPTIGWHYDRMALALHWISALLLVLMTGLGWYMMEIEHTPRPSRISSCISLWG
ncbi:hypothetical protein ACFQT4_02520 [Pseudoduganella danionis]|uniref:hypothetical protein n=1 Tax=Pseudoduganella danionis TaxID=1890295 RepID=UPI00360D7E34